MNNIKTRADVLVWAKEIVYADGAKYTPLSKSDLLVIAQCIVDPQPLKGGDWTLTQEDSKPSKPVGSSPEAEKPELSEDQCRDRDMEAPDVIKPRYQFLHEEGLDSQQAFDRFLEETSDGKTVMNFSNGQSSQGAAFAYWLCESVYGKPMARGK